MKQFLCDKYFRHKHKIRKDHSNARLVFIDKEMSCHTSEMLSKYTCRKLGTEPKYPASRPNFEYIRNDFKHGDK